MPSWGAISRRELIRGLRALGFDGPFSGGRHEFMIRGDAVVTIPNPHGRDIGVALLARVLRQAGVTRAPHGHSVPVPGSDCHVVESAFAFECAAIFDVCKCLKVTDSAGRELLLCIVAMLIKTAQQTST